MKSVKKIILCASAMIFALSSSVLPVSAEGDISEIKETEESGVYASESKESSEGEEATYTIHYDPNGAVSGSVADTVHKFNDGSTLAQNGFVYPDHVFGGWNTKKDGSGKTYYEGQNASTLTEENGEVITLYAVWSVEKDVFTFTIPTEVTAVADSSGSISGDIQFTTTSENRRWLDVNITSQNDFALVDSWDSSNRIKYLLSETSFRMEPQYRDSDTASFEKDVKLSGQDSGKAGKYTDTVNFNVSSYYETRTIVLDCNGGNVNGESQIMYTVRDGSTYGQLPVPSKSGYQFVGWKDENNNTIYSGSTVHPETEKLTAKYSQLLWGNVYAKINGCDNESLVGIGKADFYKNGEIYEKDKSTFQWISGIEGDTFRIDDFKILDTFKCVRVESSEDYKVDFENGVLKSIEFTMTPNSDKGITLYFESSSPLQAILNSTQTDTVVFDSDIPETAAVSTGTLDMFETKASTYCDGHVLHIYNPDGGKVKAPENCEKLFAYIKADTFDLRNLDVSDTTDCTMIFANSTARHIDVSDWNTSRITVLDSMFYFCQQLESLELKNWNTESVQTAYQFLWHCEKLESIDVSSFNTSECRNMCRMFGECHNLTEIKGLENFDTRKSEGFAAMFQGNGKIKEINVSSFDTSNASFLHYMFAGCSSLERIIGIENFNTSKNRTFQNMFSQCSSLESIDVSLFDTSSSDSFNGMFQYCGKLTELDLSNFDSSKIKDYSSMFAGCWILKTIYASKNFENINTAASTNMFGGCLQLVGGSGTTFDPSFIDATAARIDGGSETPGYFTKVDSKPLNTIEEESGVSEATSTLNSENFKNDVIS